MSHIISFLGGDSQVGTSMVAQSVAEALYRRKHTVLFISGSGKYGNDFLDCGSDKSIDRIRANILSGRLDGKELVQVSGREQDFSIVGATLHPFHSTSYPEDTFQILLGEAEDLFEYIIIDGGDFTDSCLSSSAAKIAEALYVVITQQPKSIKGFQLLKTHGPKEVGEKGRLILNKYLKDPSLMTCKEVGRICSQAVEGVVPYMDYGWQSEMEKKTLMGFRKYEKQIRMLVKQIEGIAEKEV